MKVVEVIQKINIKVGDINLSLTEEEARKILNKLEEVFRVEKRVEYVLHPYPVNVPPWILNPPPSYPFHQPIWYSDDAYQGNTMLGNVVNPLQGNFQGGNI